MLATVCRDLERFDFRLWGFPRPIAASALQRSGTRHSPQRFAHSSFSQSGRSAMSSSVHIQFVEPLKRESPVVNRTRPFLIAGVLALLGACSSPPPPPAPVVPAPAPPPVAEQPYTVPPAPPPPHRRYVHRRHRHYVHHARHHRRHKPAHRVVHKPAPGAAAPMAPAPAPMAPAPAPAPMAPAPGGGSTR